VSLGALPDALTAKVIDAERNAKGIVARCFGPTEIQLRLIAVMANEGARELAEGIALRASDIDVAFVHGYGFPAGKGGPMSAADRLGLDRILTEMKSAHAVGGAGSEPAPLLIELARSGKKFGDWCNA